MNSKGNMTAVEWLVETLAEKEMLYSHDIVQAKQMEKEQIEKAFEQGKANWLELKENTFEQYYNETFKLE